MVFTTHEVKNKKAAGTLAPSPFQFWWWEMMHWSLIKVIFHYNNYVHHSSSSLGSRCVLWLGEGISMPSPNYPVLCCPLSYHKKVGKFIPRQYVLGKP